MAQAAGLLTLLLLLSPMPAATASCTTCHADMTAGFNPAHGFAAENCTACHAGDASASEVENAHRGMESFPGNMANAAQTCGACHADKVESVTHSAMHTGRGMVEITRRLVDGQTGAPETDNIQSLGHGPADSMLRKLCVSCHLGQAKTAHALDPMRDRGGGCLACHINHYPGEAHPAISTAVSDGRCFGCHSRSGRISLSYTGLAEVTAEHGTGLRLADGRPVEHRPADVHYRAGMACTDCHGGAELMGEVQRNAQRDSAIPVRCTHCHAPGTGHAAVTANHERLECATCHSQWAPQCFGCHMEYDPDGRQWDHLAGSETAGRWQQRRWDTRNGLAAMGVNAEGRIALFIPGMIMSLRHPEWREDKFVRAFAPLSPHTIGRSRSCESCHRSATALGLGEGTVEVREGSIHFTPRHQILQDGLPLDAWTDPAGKLGGGTAREGLRPLSPTEMQTILLAPLAGPPEASQQPSTAAGGGNSLSPSGATYTGGTKGSALTGAGAVPERSPTK